LVVLVSALIITYSSQPESSLPPVIANGKYGIHFIEYALLSLLFVNALNMPWRHGWQIAAVAMMLAALFGVFDEMLQSLVSGRIAQVFDWTIDATGGVFGALLGTWAISTTWARSMMHQRWKKQKERAVENNDTFSTY